MRKQEEMVRQLAQKITDFIEPIITYLIVGSKKAAEEACRQVGPDVWETKRKLWDKLCSIECVELQEAARDMIVAPYDTEVRQVLIQEILKLLERNPDLVKEISSFMEDEKVKRLVTDDSLARIIKQDLQQGPQQTLIDRIRVFEELNKLLEAFVARNVNSQVPERFEVSNIEKPDQGLETVGKKSASTLRIEQIADIRQITRTDFARAEVAKTNLVKTNFAKADVELQNESQKTQFLLSLISRLEGPNKDEIMEKALDFASRIQYGDLRAQALSMVIPYLNSPKKAKLIEKALESASHIQDEDERGLVLSSFLPHLRGPSKEEFIENVLGSSFYLKYGDAKFQILSSLTPHLYGSRNKTVIEKALELVTVVYSDYQKVQALSFLIPYLNGQEKEEVIEHALELAFNLKDKDMRPEALSYVLPYLDEPRRKEILENALILASLIKSECQKAEALSSLATYLDELERH